MNHLVNPFIYNTAKRISLQMERAPARIGHSKVVQKDLKRQLIAFA